MDEDEIGVPDRDTCQNLIEQFAAITQSNEAVAQQFLQESNWSLDPAINQFFDALAAEKNETSTRMSAQSQSVDPDLEVVKALFGEEKTLTNEPPPRLQLLSWNLDGLDEISLKKRMAAVVKLVQSQEPDVIFFQEVIPEVADYFDKKLPEYKAVRANSEGYFTMTLLRVFTIFYDSHKIISFPDSLMGRNLLVVRAHVGDRHFAFLNTHLESGKEHAEERKNQLRTAFRHAQAFPPNVTTIFGGDLNLRDSEEMIPDGFHDAWCACGSRKDSQFTWDTLRNTNKTGFGKFKPRCRFDRIYFRPEPGRVNPTHFGLVGAQRVPDTQKFPSDHWGVIVCFSLRHR